MLQHQRCVPMVLVSRQKKTEMANREMMPAIPPEDYKGSIASWHVALIERGLWDGQGWHGDVEIEEDVWWEILEDCEG